MNDRDRIILQKIAKYISESNSYTEGMSFEAFSKDTKTINATAFIFGQIGELAKRISAEIQQTNPQIPWKGIRGLRNRIVHDYENIDMKILWETITNDMPDLFMKINAMLQGADL